MALGTGRVFLHPSSVNFRCGKFESGWLAYSEIVETSKVFVRESSMVPVYAVLLFGGGCEAARHFWSSCVFFFEQAGDTGGG